MSVTPHIQHMADALASLAHLKMSAAVKSGGLRDKPSLHRWVLLRNSVNSLRPSSPDAACISLPDDDADDWYLEEEEEDNNGVVESDCFVFPDTIATCCDLQASTSEAAWLDALLEKLGEEGEDIGESDDSPVTQHHTDGQEDVLFGSPPDYDSLPFLAAPPPLLISTTVGGTYPPYPYPPKTPSTAALLYGSALPYPEYIPRVPDAVEDTSDDESETTASGPLTPYGRSIASLADSPLVTLKEEHRVLEPSVQGTEHLSSDAGDVFCHPFRIDSVSQSPFGRHHHHHHLHHHTQEC